MNRVTLAADDDFASWRDAARGAIAAGIAPEEIIWEVAGTEALDLFGAPPHAAGPRADGHSDLRVPRELLALMRLALMHRAPARFALAYRILWRLRDAPWLAHDPADADMVALRSLAKAVKRDIHKMHAFVRFRKVGEANGREQFAAWFEPEHYIVRATASFFRDRFTGMDWVIVTPAASIAWDGATLCQGPGGTRAQVPGEDAVEAEWRAYYASIFNPARLKLDAMRREMPKRYWRNLPEAPLIFPLAHEAEARVEQMVSKQDGPDLFAPQEAEAGPRFDDLDSLYAALCEEEEPPSPGFSDRIVLGEGPLRAPLMLVGEQPGDQEDELGHPFVGPAGQLLDRCLEEAGIARDETFLTNAVKRFKFAQRGKRRLHQTPTAGDIAHYRWWLREEIRLVDPAVVVSLGATALHALSGRKQALGPVRGTAIDWDGRALLPTVHPSFLLRLPDAQARKIEHEKFVRDLGKALKAARA